MLLHGVPSPKCQSSNPALTLFSPVNFRLSSSFSAHSSSFTSTTVTTALFFLLLCHPPTSLPMFSQTGKRDCSVISSISFPFSGYSNLSLFFLERRIHFTAVLFCDCFCCFRMLLCGVLIILCTYFSSELIPSLRMAWMITWLGGFGSDCFCRC